MILMWLGQFEITYVSISIFISLIISGLFSIFLRKDINIIPRISIWVVVIISLVCLIGLLFPHETFGGRDEGQYPGYAVMLAKNGNLQIPDYLRTTIGDYMGFNTQTRISYETPVYIVWLGIQSLLFGTQWMLRSNVVLVGLGLGFLFLTSSFITKKSLSLITILLFTTCLPFLWFFRETMTENMAFFLLWTSIVFLFTMIRTGRSLYLIGLILGMWLFSLTRLEGVLIQLTTLLVILFMVVIKVISLKKVWLMILVYLLVIGSSIFISNPFNQNSLFRKVAVHVYSLIQHTISPTVGIQQFNFDNIINTTIVASSIILKDRIPHFVVQMLTKYNLALILLSIFLIMPSLFTNRKKINKNIYLIGLIIIISPEFYKFIDPSVTMEQPWMYRRYIYALLPMGYLCFTMYFKKIVNIKLFLLLCFFLLTVNIILSAKIITLKNNWDITSKVENITSDISPKSDFVIIRDWEILHNYFPTTYLTYFKEARALVRDQIAEESWSPKEKKYMNFTYDKLYLLSSKKLDKYENFRLVERKVIDLEYNQLEPNCKLNLLKSKINFSYIDLTYLPYQEVISFCSQVDNRIIETKNKLILYELIYQE